MQWTVLSLLLSLALTPFLLLASPLSRPPMAPLTTTPVDLDLYARFLSDELACDFDNITYCGLQNNGGWSFKQSLLELVQQLTQAKVNVSVLSSVPNHFVCADWGVANTRASSSPPLLHPGGPAESVASLEVFILPPSPRPLRQTSGKVFYVGTGPLDPTASNEKVVMEEWEGGTEEPNTSLGVCLEIDVRLSSEQSDSVSKLTVKFRSMSQTIEASPGLTLLPPPTSPLHPVPTSMPSVTGKIAFLSSLADWILWGSSSTPVQQRQYQSKRITPPLDRWLHLILPLDTQLLPESPLHFALYGHAGVCVDNLHVNRCLTSTIPNLYWPPNNTLVLEGSAPPVLLLAPPHTESVPSSATYHPLLTGAFFFASLLVILVALLIIIFVASIVCGRKRRIRRKKGTIGGGGLEKGNGVGGPATLTGADLLRSPSISSLPGAAVHQRPIEEILHYGEQDAVEKVDEGDVREGHHHTSGQGSLDTRRLRLKRPLRRPPRRTQSVDSRLQVGHQIQPYEAQKQHGVRHGKRQPQSRQQPQHRRGRGWRSMDADPPANVTPQNAGQRLSLLLAINEDNELVLVTPGSTNASTVHNGARNVSNSPSNTTSGSSGTATIATTASSATTVNTSAAIAASTPANGRLSSAEAEATLQEMAASVAHLGTRTGPERVEAEGDSVVSSSTTGSSAGLPPLYEEAVHLLSERQQQRQLRPPTSPASELSPGDS